MAKYTKLTSQPSLLRSQHHSWSHLMVQSVMSALNETKERAYTMQYSSAFPDSSFFDVVPPDGMSVYAGSPIVVVGDVRLVIFSADTYVEDSVRVSAQASSDQDVSPPPLLVLELGQGTMDAPLSPDRLHSECQVEEEVIKGVANVECGPIGDESCGGRERC